jgi:hypothetical protein
MRKIALITVVLATVLFGCTSPEKKAQKLIEEKLQEILNDPKSYEPVSFGSLDSAFTSVYENLDYIRINAKYTVYSGNVEDKSNYEYFDEDKIKYVVDFELWQSEIDTAKKYIAVLEKMEKEFIPEFKGWSMTHKLRAKNAMNATILGEYIFWFDKDITKIIDYKKKD